MAKQAYELLEAELATWAGYEPENVVCCSSGSAALHMALQTLQLRTGTRKVVVPDLTMIACARAVHLARLLPTFVDCRDDLLMDLRCLARKCGYHGENPSAVMVVHLYGRQQDTDAVRAATSICVPAIVEDLAEAHGVAPHPDTDAACWSFYRNKCVYGEEGGAIAFKNKDHAATARRMRTLGFTPAHDFNHDPDGMNYRMSNCHAELIRISLRSFKENMLLRRTVEEIYDRACPEEWRMPERVVPWVYDLRIPGMDYTLQYKLIHALQTEGIAARHCFKPMSTQKEFSTYGDPGPNALKASAEVVYLPIQPQTPTWEIHKAIEIVKTVIRPE